MDEQFEYTGKKINYKISGSGNCIVLLHGFLESLLIWDNFTDKLSSEFKLVAIDLPGHGNTDNFSETHTMEFMAETVKAVLDHLGIEECVMVGHSMGGYLTLAFAKQYPEMLNGFCLFHSQAAADSVEAKQNRDKTIKIVMDDRKGFIRNFIPDLFAPSNREIYKDEIEVLKNRANATSKEGIVAALMGMKERSDKTDILKTFDKPILYIIGKEDSRIPVDTALSQCALANRCTVHILGGIGHMGYIEAKDETLSFIKQFCNDVFL